jgi:signal transduction histidine kinase
MLIKRQFYLAFAAIVAALLVTVALLLSMHWRIEQSEQTRAWANRVMKSVFDCSVLGSESILQDNPRARDQYAIAAKNLQKLLDDAPGQRVVAAPVAELRANKARLDRLLLESMRLPQATIALEDLELQTMMVSQWLFQARTLVEAAQGMRGAASNESRQLRNLSLWVGLGTIALIALVTGGIFWRSYRTLVSPLQQLSEGARRVGAGDLAHRLPVPRRDEIGVAAESFNLMTRQLSERQAQIDEKLRDLEAFSYSVAHDLKGPLRSVVGFGALLESEHKEQLGDEGRRYVQRMRDASLRMSTLIDDLLEYGQLTHRRVDIQAVDLQTICSELMAEMRNEIAAAHASIRSPSESHIVFGNEFLLKQTFRNLIANGMKFVRPGSPAEIDIRAKSDGDGWTTVEVIDNGIGIAPEFHEKIFALFHRLHEHTRYPGTGIGLAVVQKSIERLGGHVGVRSEVGKGSAFWLKLRTASVHTPEQLERARLIDR